MSSESTKVTGGCLCGNVRYEVNGPLRGVVNCHCNMCRRLHGNYGPHTKAKKAHVTITKSDGLSWYRTSNIARRGFCQQCGSGVFWEPFEQDSTGIIAGTLDFPDDLETIGHVFTSEKAGFYEITDELPRFEQSSNGRLPGDFR